MAAPTYSYEPEDVIKALSLSRFGDLLELAETDYDTGTNNKGNESLDDFQRYHEKQYKLYK